MSKSYTLEPAGDLYRYPGENLAAWYNRQLRARGRYDIEWYYAPGGSMRIRDVRTDQSKLDL